MNTLYIMVGLPGSGKTSWAKENLPDTIYISRDDIRFTLVKEDEEYFSKEKEVFNTFVNKINNSLHWSFDVVADATHLNKKSRAKLFSALHYNKETTKVVAIYMDQPIKVCLAQNERRKGTRAYVPPRVIKDMSKNLQKPDFEEFYGVFNEIHTISKRNEV